jgi:hypothetical protein
LYGKWDLLSLGASDSLAAMFSHIVIFWINPDVEDAEKRLVDGLNHYLPDIPGVISMHVGRCAPSDRPVVDQSYQVALNITFKNKIVQDEYQVHPQHVEFVEKVFKQVCDRVVVYDFGDLE